MIYQKRSTDFETRKVTPCRIIPETLTEAQDLAYLVSEIVDHGYANLDHPVFVGWLSTQPEVTPDMRLIVFSTAFATACALGATMWLLKNR